jgi:hypothetical protein
LATSVPNSTVNATCATQSLAWHVAQVASPILSTLVPFRTAAEMHLRAHRES